jgi:hypothetical protein
VCGGQISSKQAEEGKQGKTEKASKEGRKEGRKKK